MGALDDDLESAWVAYGGHHFEPALAEFRAIAQRDPANAQARAGVARSLCALGLADEAIVAARSAIEVAPHERWGHVALVVVLVDASRHAEALAALAAAEQADIPGGHRAQLHAMATYSAIALERIPEAVGLAKRGVDLDPLAVETHAAHASALALDHRLGPALVAIDRALAIAPDDADCRERRKGIVAGVDLLQRELAAYAAIDERERTAGAHVGMGMLLNALGRHTEALRAFDAAIALDPDDAAAWEGRGWALHREGGHFPADVDAFRKADELRQGTPP